MVADVAQEDIYYLFMVMCITDFFKILKLDAVHNRLCIQDFKIYLYSFAWMFHNYSPPSGIRLLLVVVGRIITILIS